MCPQNIKVPTQAGLLNAVIYGDKTQRDAVLLWPSIFSSHKVYSEIAALLAQNHFVISLDPPGHGESRVQDKTLTFDACVEASFEVLDDVGVDNVRWVGTSWGGLVGALAALKKPDRLEHLTCLGTPFSFDRRFSLKTFMILMMCRFIGSSKMYADGVARDFFKENTRKRKDVMAAHLSAFRQANRAELMKAANLVFRERADLMPLISEIGVPTMVVAGLSDHLYSVDMQRDAASAIRNSDFVTVDAAHIAAVDMPSEVVALLESAWRKTG